MKKHTLIYIIVIFIIAIAISFTLTLGKNEIKDETKISQIVQDSNLEILLTLGNFERANYEISKLLETSMKISEKIGCMNENVENGYIQYVNADELHEIITQLTGIQMEAPIQIEDFYYVYDSENEYYYCVPIIISSYSIDSINHIYENNGTFTIESSISKKQDGEIVDAKTVTTTLKYVEENTYAKYQIISQKFN